MKTESVVSDQPVRIEQADPKRHFTLMSEKNYKFYDMRSACANLPGSKRFADLKLISACQRTVPCHDLVVTKVSLSGEHSFLTA